jgi:hypothetical protein
MKGAHRAQRNLLQCGPAALVRVCRVSMGECFQPERSPLREHSLTSSMPIELSRRFRFLVRPQLLTR